jgi:hypothetical protein
LNDVLAAECAGGREQVAARVGVEDDLGQPVAVAEIDKDESAVIAPSVNPTAERDVTPGMIAAQIAARMCP